ncbi:hypothetical protein HMPREF9257_0869 [Eremococcus coleocola ACS-139-V-Col8]|uniref:Uncharacterized protein n=1 Tax=Eremococcus coleocola ACS-139-V-Col8 TaxID=908337 RepID=E4KLN7_9LACT|nr:hypothetical protein HMPREF9257_0869 [Eremococcus coleocola ACS-139-V-Col8]
MSDYASLADQYLAHLNIDILEEYTSIDRTELSKHELSGK